MNTTREDNHRLRLGHLIEARRIDLRLTQIQFAKAVPMSKEGLRKLIKGSGDIRPLTKRGIEDALRWAPGSIDAILAGGEPTELSDDSPPTGRERLSDHLDSRRRELGMEWSDLAAAAGIEDDRMVEIFKGQEPDLHEARGLDQALRWTPGSLASVLAGDEPVPMEHSPPDVQVTSSDNAHGADSAWVSHKELAPGVVELFAPPEIAALPMMQRDDGRPVRWLQLREPDGNGPEEWLVTSAPDPMPTTRDGLEAMRDLYLGNARRAQRLAKNEAD